MLAAYLVARRKCPNFAPLIVCLFWANHLGIVLILHYEFVYWVAVVSTVGQLAFACLLWALVQWGPGCVRGRKFSAMGLHMVVWSVHLAIQMQHHETLRREGSNVEIPSAQKVWVPLVFGLFGLLVTLRALKVARGHLFPQNMPRWAIWVGFILAFIIQIGSAFVCMTFTLQWSQGLQMSLIFSSWAGFAQDVIINEPLKCILLKYAVPAMKTAGKGVIGRMFKEMFDIIGFGSG
jgi:hypothetical protein